MRENKETSLSQYKRHVGPLSTFSRLPYSHPPKVVQIAYLTHYLSPRLELVPCSAGVTGAQKLRPPPFAYY